MIHSNEHLNVDHATSILVNYGIRSVVWATHWFRDEPTTLRNVVPRSDQIDIIGMDLVRSICEEYRSPGDYGQVLNRIVRSLHPDKNIDKPKWSRKAREFFDVAMRLKRGSRMAVNEMNSWLSIAARLIRNVYVARERANGHLEVVRTKAETSATACPRGDADDAQEMNTALREAQVCLEQWQTRLQRCFELGFDACDHMVGPLPISGLCSDALVAEFLGDVEQSFLEAKQSDLVRETKSTEAFEKTRAGSAPAKKRQPRKMKRTGSAPAKKRQPTKKKQRTDTLASSEAKPTRKQRKNRSADANTKKKRRKLGDRRQRERSSIQDELTGPVTRSRAVVSGLVSNK